ncbi:MAG TPA: hypothetical protein VFW22_06240 [Pseudolabrys sp.]|nr:hypothetical protein [Pseudolabrys sp.]
MSYRRIAMMFIGALFTAFFVASIVHDAQAQTVDPCSYGCPKDGCNCPKSGGGPVGK